MTKLTVAFRNFANALKKTNIVDSTQAVKQRQNKTSREECKQRESKQLNMKKTGNNYTDKLTR
jgi:hypothetical protein